MKIYIKDNGILTNAGSFMLLFPATPFAFAPGVQKYLNYIQDYRHMVKENNNIKQEETNKYRDLK